MISYDPSQPLIVIHIPKAAGVSSQQFFRHWFGDGYLSHYFDERQGLLPPRHDLRGLHSEQRPVVLHGHFNRLRHFGVEDYYPEVQQFITILRDPFSQFASDAGMRRSDARQWSRLQQHEDDSDDARLDWLAAVLQRYLDTRGLIPRGSLVEVRYRDLISDRVATLERIYSALGLDLPAALRSATSPSYRRNRHPELGPELKDRIREAYRPFVEAGLFDPAELA